MVTDTYNEEDVDTLDDDDIHLLSFPLLQTKAKTQLRLTRGI